MSISPESWPCDTGLLIPSYRSAESLLTLLPRILAQVPASNILVIDDGSGDSTPEICMGLSVTCHSHPENRGKGAALATGFNIMLKRGVRWVITMDADGQHSPDDLLSFVTARTLGWGICIGARRMLPGSMPVQRIISNRITSLILSLLCNTPIPDSQCGYRLYHADLIAAVSMRTTRFEAESEIIIQAVRHGFSIGSIAVQTLYLGGKSNISHLRDTLRWITTVIGLWRETPTVKS